MSTLAAVRPDSWNFPLFVHIVGVVLLVGGLVTAAVCSATREATRGCCGSGTGRSLPWRFLATS